MGPSRTTLAAFPLALAFFLSPLISAAADPPKPPEPAASNAAAGDTYNKILADFNAAQREFSDAYQKATTDPERQKLVDEKYPDREKFAARMVAFAAAHPDDPEAVDAAAWAVTYTFNGASHDAALKMLSGPYVRSGKILTAIQRLAYSQSPAAVETLKKIVEENPSAEIKGYAAYAMGENLAGHGKSAEAEKVFEDVVAKHGQVKGRRGTLADDAKSQLHEIRDLAVGKVAPDIEGEDVDGHKFKLSEYRGKVVVLDFWGDW
jgi:hypothetical protein